MNDSHGGAEPSVDTLRFALTKLFYTRAKSVQVLYGVGPEQRSMGANFMYIAYSRATIRMRLYSR